MSTETVARPRGTARPATGRAADEIATVLTRGTAAGLTGGLMFILANMWYTTTHGKPAVAPLLAISTIFYGSDKPVADPTHVVAGLVLHLGLSIAFGVAFVAIAAVLGLGSRPLLLLVGGLVYGLVLYLVNFQVFGRLFFPFFVNPMGPNQGFELWIHPVTFGLLLVPFALRSGGINRSVRT